jgi:hypothetical protein
MHHTSLLLANLETKTLGFSGRRSQFYIVSQHTTTQPNVIPRFERDGLTNEQSLSIESGAKATTQVLQLRNTAMPSDYGVTPRNADRDLALVAEVDVGHKVDVAIGTTDQDIFGRGNRKPASCGRNDKKMTDASGRSKFQHMGGYRIIKKLDTSQFDLVTHLKFVRRPRPQSLPIYEQTVAAAQVFDRVTTSRANDSGVLARYGVCLSIFVGQINIRWNAKVRVETAQH